MKKLLYFTILLFSVLPIASKACTIPDSIGLKKADGKYYIIHEIDSAQGWYSIARLYKISYAELRLANKDSSDKLVPGGTLLIPANKLKIDDAHFDRNYIQPSSELFHTVKEGETLFSIAKQFNTNVDSLRKWNNLPKGGIKYGSKIKVGSGLTANADRKPAGADIVKPPVKVNDAVTEKAKANEKAETKDKKASSKPGSDKIVEESKETVLADKKEKSPEAVKSSDKTETKNKKEQSISVVEKNKDKKKTEAIEKQQLASDTSKTSVKDESKTKKEISETGKDIVKAEKKKTAPVESKQVNLNSGVIRDSVPALNKDVVVADKKRSEKKDNVKADSSKLDKKSVPVQTKIIKTATEQHADSVKIIKTASATKTNSKKKDAAPQPPSRSMKSVFENGIASWIQDDDINPNKYYSLHRTAPIGTIVKITNKMNKKYVFVKVVGTLPDTGDNTDLVIKISKASAEKLGVRDSRFQCELSYSITEK